MQRVVVTGYGLTSCLGNDPDTVTRALREGRSGIRPVDEYRKLGLRTQVAGVPDLSTETPIDRKLRRFMGDAAAYAYYAMRKAVAAANLSDEQVRSPRTGLVVGSGVGSPFEHMEAIDTMRARGLNHVLPYKVPRIMGSTVAANLGTAFGIRGHSYGLTSACATSAQCIAHAADLIRLGKQDLVFCGGAEEVRWTSTAMFDAMGALSTRYGDASASRPFDRDRDGFVIAGGAGLLILEALDHALTRGARIHAELIGCGISSDGADMVLPDRQGAARAMRLALEEVNALGHAPRVDYINAHATSTPAGDIVELQAIREVFGAPLPLISSTKGLSGHPIAAAGAHEAIYGLLMLEHEFIAPCANLRAPDAQAEGFPLVRECLSRKIDTFMSNSFGFGGANASVLFSRYAQ